MKSLATVLVLILGLAAKANPYAFITDFELKSVSVNGSIATITVEHFEIQGPPKFEFVKGAVCEELFPLQCWGTVVRLDDSVWSDARVLTEFQVDLAPFFGAKDVDVVIYGPNGKKISVRY